MVLAAVVFKALFDIYMYLYWGSGALPCDFFGRVLLLCSRILMCSSFFIQNVIYSYSLLLIHLYSYTSDCILILHYPVMQGLCWNSQFRIQRFSFETRATPSYCRFRIWASFRRQKLQTVFLLSIALGVPCSVSLIKFNVLLHFLTWHDAVLNNFVW